VLQGLASNSIAPLTLKGIRVWAARTGYTGSEMGFELFAHPERLGDLWDLLLETGRARGVLPCGLGARDSLRIQAGLPLFGHELEGPAGLTMHEAGYGFVPKINRPFFIGKTAYKKRIAQPQKRLLRLKGQGRKSIRPGHTVLDDKGQAAGTVTSFAFTNTAFDYYLLAAVRASFQPPPGSAVRAVRAPAGESGQALAEGATIELELLPRFPTHQEKKEW
jgi:glycine hydroxymethyltransferase